MIIAFRNGTQYDQYIHTAYIVVTSGVFCLLPASLGLLLLWIYISQTKELKLRLKRSR